MTNPYEPAGGTDPQQVGQQPYPGQQYPPAGSGGFPQQQPAQQPPGEQHPQGQRQAPSQQPPSQQPPGQQLPGQQQSGQVPSGPHAAGYPQSGGFGAPQAGQPQPAQPSYGFDPNAAQYGYPPPQQYTGQAYGGVPQPYGSVPSGQPPQGFDPNVPGYGQPQPTGYPGFDPNQPPGYGTPGMPPQGHYSIPPVQQPPQGFARGAFGPQLGPAPASSAPNPLRPWLIGGGVAAVVIVVVLIGGLVWPGWFTTTTVLDQTQVQAGVQKILTEQYHVADVSAVSCPAGEPVTAGTTFTCSVTVGGAPKHVTITVKDSSGLYEVARPS